MVKFLSPRNLEKFTSLYNERCLLIPILRDTKVHWTKTSPSFVYVYGLESKAEWVVGLTHNDCENVAISFLSNFFSKPNYLYQKKVLGDCGACGDVETAFWMQTGQRLDDVVRYPAICHEYWRLFAGRENINDFIPIMQWIDHCADLRDVFLAACRGFDFSVSGFRQCERMVMNLAQLDAIGLQTTNGLHHGHYDAFTLTGRPSNYYRGVNLLALEKTATARSKYISRFGQNGILLEVDLRAFHMYLVYKLNGKEMPTDIYEKLGKELYFNTNDLTGEQLAQSKLQTFRQLYGQISLEYSEHETFKMVNAIQTLFWHKYNSNDLETVIFNRKVKFNKTVDRTKVFNYMLQNFETELCSLFIDVLLKGLQTFESKLVLYVYDSFLFDVKKNEAAQVFDFVKTVFGQIPYTIKSGPNYWEMSKR